MGMLADIPKAMLNAHTLRKCAVAVLLPFHLNLESVPF